jgi:ribosomal protein S18 acetylase RimI-like enzyme
MATPRLRSAQPCDAGLLARLNATLHAVHLRERPDFFKAPRLAEVEEWFRSLLDKPSTRCWIAELDTTPTLGSPAEPSAVGYLLMTEHQRAENVFCRERHWHEIDHIGVEEAFRGQGIGRALLQTALAVAAQTGTNDVELASWSFNSEAHALFERCGFRQRLLRFDLRSAR